MTNHTSLRHKAMRFVYTNFLLVTTLLCCWTVAHCQTVRGDHLIHTGIGIINPQPFTFSIFSSGGVGNPSPSYNLNYQYSVTNKFLIGAFSSYYRVNADYLTDLDEVAGLLEDADLNDLIQGLDCLLLGNCSTTIAERNNVFSLGGKFSYIKTLRKDFEVYVSAYLGYSINRRQTITEKVLSSVSEQLDLGVDVPRFIYFSSIGIRTYLNDHWALQGEFGYGNSHLLNLGITYRITKDTEK